MTAKVPSSRPRPRGWSAARQVDPLTAGDPRALGPYRIDGVLGHGGMGTVYLGRDPDDTPVAVKVVRPDLARQPEFLARFRREADLARRVARFCTAEVIDVGTDPHLGLPYLVTEYVDGLTLFEAVRSGGPMTPADLDRLAVAVAAGLIAVHGAGMVHRDLKPSNVLLSPMGPRVIDFGIARALDATTMITQQSQSVGTPAFMSPEQARGDQVGPAADVFAWGGIVTFAGTGRTPFGVGSTPTLMFRTVYEPPDLDGLPDDVRSVVEAAMAKDPADRPTARALFDRLMGLSVPSPTVPSPTAPSSGTPSAGAPTTITPPPSIQPPIPVVDHATRVTGSSASSPATTAPPPATPASAPASARPARSGPFRPRRLAAAGIALAVAAVAVVATLLVTKAAADRDRREDASRRLAAQAHETVSTDEWTAQQLALNAYRLEPTREAADAVSALFVSDSPTKVSIFVEEHCDEYAFDDDDWERFAPEVSPPDPCG